MNGRSKVGRQYPILAWLDFTFMKEVVVLPVAFSSAGASRGRLSEIQILFLSTRTHPWIPHHILPRVQRNTAQVKGFCNKQGRSQEGGGGGGNV